MSHPQQDDPVQPAELDDILWKYRSSIADIGRKYIGKPKSTEDAAYKEVKQAQADTKTALNRLITREAVRLCNAVIGEDEPCDGDHGKWVAGCPICERNDTRADQRQRLADLVKGEGGNKKDAGTP